MNILKNFFSISFGKKTPVYKCHVLKPNANKNVEATVYEYDCTDLKDIDTFKNMKGYWRFSKSIAYDMHAKFSNNVAYLNHKFYSMEDEDKETIGIMQCEVGSDFVDVYRIESKYGSGYKYVASNLLAIAGIETGKFDKNCLTVSVPFFEVRDFYIKKCGFKPTLCYSLDMDKNGIKCLQNKVENKTNGKIIDVNI